MSISVASAQYPITFHIDFESWEKHTQEWVENAVNKKANLLLFPEYAAMELVSLLEKELWNEIEAQVQSLQTLVPRFCEAFSKLSKKHKVIIVAPSIPIAENGKVHNRVFVFNSKGLVGFQDKFFMTRFETEDWNVQTPQKTLTLFEADWGSFGIQTCYDIEFPLGSQLLCAAGASLILAPSCTETKMGATRVHVGARARALENQCYTVVSQVVGDADWSLTVDINYGFSAFYSTPDKGFPDDGILASAKPQKEDWLIYSLDFDKIKEVRKDGQVLNFRDLQLTNIGFKNDSIKIVKVST